MNPRLPTAYRVLNFWIILVFIVGLAMTTLSWMNVCRAACGEVHLYKYFGYDFEILGFVFFIGAGLLHALSLKFTWLGYIVGLMLAAAVGSEVNFILIQKYVIGQWCLLCLTIAAIIGVLALLYLTKFFYWVFFLNQSVTWGKVMKGFIKTTGIILACSDCL